MTEKYGTIIRARNVNDALPMGLFALRDHGKPAESRGIKTLRVPGPVMTVYSNPRERVLFDPIRDANPFFHLMESLWILSGSDKVDLPRYFLNSIVKFSDNGRTFHGAYGHRLRQNRGVDQLITAAKVLILKPDSRQCVISLWDPVKDLDAVTKDIPCNDMIMFDIVEGRLNMTVCNRSNDAIWGAYGANAVQFSMIQEVLAALCGVETGVYVQQSNNFHVYPDNAFWFEFFKGEYTHGHVHNPYSTKQVTAGQLCENATDAMRFLTDCDELCYLAENPEDVPMIEGDYGSVFFKETVVPAIRAYDAYKAKRWDDASAYALHVASTDWRLAMSQWVARRAP